MVNQERQPLTDLLLRKLKGGREVVEIWDAKIRSRSGVPTSGTKSFILLYRFKGERRRHTLGLPSPSLDWVRPGSRHKRCSTTSPRTSIQPRRKRMQTSVCSSRMWSKNSCVCIVTAAIANTVDGQRPHFARGVSPTLEASRCTLHHAPRSARGSRCDRRARRADRREQLARQPSGSFSTGAPNAVS